MRRLLAVALATLVLALFPALAASAVSDDPNSGTLVYTGTFTGASSSTVTLTLDCVAGTCSSDDQRPTITFVDGVAVSPASGNWSSDGCDYTATSERDLVMTPTAITGTSTVVENSYVCPDDLGGSGSDDTAYATTIDLAYVSGETCLIDASCTAAAGSVAPVEDVTTEQALEAAGGDFAPGERNDQPLPSGGEREFAAPTELSQVATIADVITPANLTWAAGGTLVLGALVIVPTAFANSAVETLFGRLRGWWRRRRGLPDAEGSVGFRGWAWAAGGVAAAAVLTAFADPNFGLDAAALRVLLSVAAAFALEVGVGWLAVILLMRATTPGATPSFHFTPLSLLVVAGAVLLARLSGFEPAIVFGLVAGLVFAGLVSVADHARAALIGLGWAYGIGILAWVVYSLLDPTDAALVVIRELLAAATLAGVSALPIALLPLSGLPGATIWAWRKPVWIAAYAVALFSFLLILLPLPGAWSDIGVGLGAWVAVIVAYSLAAIGAWLAVTKPWRTAVSAG